MAETFVQAGLRRAHGSLGCGDGHAAAQCGVEHYNDVHPHSALKMLSPRMFRRRSAQSSVTACPKK